MDVRGEPSYKSSKSQDAAVLLLIMVLSLALLVYAAVHY